MGTVVSTVLPFTTHMPDGVTSNQVLFNGFYYSLSDDGFRDTIYKSSDLVAWTSAPSSGDFSAGFPPEGISIVFGGFWWFIWVDSGTNNYYKSSDGNSFSLDHTTSDFPLTTASRFFAFVIGATVYLVSERASGTFYTSTNLITWTSHTPNIANLAQRYFHYVVQGGSLFAFPIDNNTGWRRAYNCTNLDSWVELTADWGLGNIWDFQVVSDGTAMYIVSGLLPASAPTVVHKTLDGVSYSLLSVSSTFTSYVQEPWTLVHSGALYVLCDGSSSQSIYKLDLQALTRTPL